MFQSKVYARVGLAGNPSDGFNGKTLSACVRNWSADVRIVPAAHGRVIIDPNPIMDSLSYINLEHLADQTCRYGHYGALRLIHATCAYFYKTYREDVAPGCGFDIVYKSTIPRQVGLGGSSAIVVALLNCLYDYFEIDVSLEERAHIAWGVENEELGITAGLQDRVIQTFGGLVYMDFDKDIMQDKGYGNYERLDYPLPNAFIAYTDSPCKNSGLVHNPIRQLFEGGNAKVARSMVRLAKIACGAREALKLKDYDALGSLMEFNFATRLALYGDVGNDNIQMIDIASRWGCPAKLPGSGGAIVGLYREEQYEPLLEAYELNDYECVKVVWDQ